MPLRTGGVMAQDKLAMRSSFEQFFPSGADIILVSDSKMILDDVADSDIAGYSYREVGDGIGREVECAIIVRVDGLTGDLTQDLYLPLEKSRCLTIPLASFGRRLSDFRYLLKLLNNIDVTASCKRVNAIVDLLQGASQGLKISDSHGERLSIGFSDTLDIMKPKFDPIILPGEWVSIAAYLEVGMVPTDLEDAFVLEGQLEVEGVSVACHIHEYEIARPKVDAAWKYCSDLREAGGFPLTLGFSDSRIISVRTMTGVEVLNDILHFVDDTQDVPVEVAISTLQSKTQWEVDWGVNSQINEAIGGVHIAIGAGIRGGHIDFVSTGATVRSV